MYIYIYIFIHLFIYIASTALKPTETLSRGRGASTIQEHIPNYVGSLILGSYEPILSSATNPGLGRVILTTSDGCSSARFPVLYVDVMVSMPPK